MKLTNVCYAILVSTVAYGADEVRYVGVFTNGNQRTEIEFSTIVDGENSYHSWRSASQSEEVYVTKEKAYFASTNFKPFFNRRITELKTGSFNGFSHCPFIVSQKYRCTSIQGTDEKLAHLPAFCDPDFKPVLLPMTEEKQATKGEIRTVFRIEGQGTRVSARIEQDFPDNTMRTSLPASSIETYRVDGNPMEYKWRFLGERATEFPNLKQFLLRGSNSSDVRTYPTLQIEREGLTFAFSYTGEKSLEETQAEALKDAKQFAKQDSKDQSLIFVAIMAPAIAISVIVFVKYRKRKL